MNGMLASRFVATTSSSPIQKVILLQFLDAISYEGLIMHFDYSYHLWICGLGMFQLIMSLPNNALNFCYKSTSNFHHYFMFCIFQET
jgi:hypothetical protein